MRAIQLAGARQLELRELAEPPAPGPGEVLVEVLAVGICGSDLHMYETGEIGGLKSEEPFTLGHEFSARIVTTTEGAVDGTGRDLEPGQRVAVDPHVACGHCEQCREGNPNLCPHHYFFGVAPTHGALCERMVVPAANCFLLPDSMSNAGGALLEPMGVALHSVNYSRLRPGDTVAVVGCGSIGILITRLALLGGAARVLAFDRLPWRVELARKWGAEAHTVKGDEAVGIVGDLTRSRGVDVAVEAASADESVGQCVDMARYGGRVSLVGISAANTFSMNPAVARRKGLTLRLIRRMKHTYPRCIRLASGQQPKVPLDELVTHVYPLERAAEAIDAAFEYREGLIKAVVALSRDRD